MSLYQFLIAVRGQDGQNLTNERGETTSHLVGMFYRTIRIIENGLKPVYVFDGKPPEMKSGELAKRKDRRDLAEKDLEEAKEQGDTEGVNNAVRGGGDVRGACQVGPRVGGRERGHGHAVFRRARAAAPADVQRGEEAADPGVPPAERARRPRAQVRGLKNVGPKSAFNLIKQHRNIETVLNNLNANVSVPADFDYKAARKLFIDPDVADTSAINLVWKAPDIDAICKFMCDENGFSRERITKACEKLNVGLKKSQQGRLDSFFKAAPNPAGDTKKAKHDAAAAKSKRKTPATKSKPAPKKVKKEE
ncbi:Flap endonuclease 1 [Smittium culicis]|uniref:Flap endonuclease 1 n=1 Tax=Smittium culicis TaxID=133412 RepID=A0A1R1Y7E4_9FUNG|nr:Flap endonuclease 1 [Smittium culicis]